MQEYGFENSVVEIVETFQDKLTNEEKRALSQCRQAGAQEYKQEIKKTVRRLLTMRLSKDEEAPTLIEGLVMEVIKKGIAKGDARTLAILNDIADKEEDKKGAENKLEIYIKQLEGKKF